MPEADFSDSSFLGLHGQANDPTYWEPVTYVIQQFSKEKSELGYGKSLLYE